MCAIGLYPHRLVPLPHQLAECLWQSGWWGLLRQAPHMHCMRCRGLQAQGVGLLRQYTASPEPPRAMNTTETAEGTHTRGSEKCVCASRKPSAALCIPAQETPQA